MGLISLIDEDRMINLDMVYSRVPKSVQTIFWILIRVAVIFLGVIMVVSYKDMYPILKTSKYSTMQWLSKAWLYLPSAVTGVYFVLVSVYGILNHFLGEKKDSEGGNA